MSIDKVISVLEPNWTRMKDRMSSVLSSDVTLLDETNKSLLENGGKCLRPMLTLLMAGACGKLSEKSVAVATAVELLHNATLLHDDVADNSSQRRGRPTVMSLLGPSPAVLIGDFWLAKCVDILLDELFDKRIFKLFSKTLENLAEGEMLQLEKSLNMDISSEEYFRIIYCKTASLFEAAIESAAITADADEQTIMAASEYARNIGTAFQIKDDILDYEGDASLGKPVGADLKEGKITLPLLLSLEGSDREAEIRSLVKEAGSDGDALQEVLRFVKENDGIGRATKRLNEFVEKAISALERIPDSQEKELLEELARYNAIRTI